MTARTLALAAVSLLVAAALLPAPQAAAGPAAARQTIATARAFDFRVSLVATRGPAEGGAPAATVTIVAARRVGGTWRSLGQLPVGKRNGWFWFVVTDPEALRTLSISTSGSPRVSVRLLITPSIGPSPLYRFHVAGNRLVRG
jgi:hypothetical protein